MRNYKLLSIDETGKAVYSHQSKLFIVSGVVIPERLKERLDHKTRKLKKKYFGDEEIVFHTRDMLRGKGEFQALSNPEVAKHFWLEFFSFINCMSKSFARLLAPNLNK